MFHFIINVHLNYQTAKVLSSKPKLQSEKIFIAMAAVYLFQCGLRIHGRTLSKPGLNTETTLDFGCYSSGNEGKVWQICCVRTKATFRYAISNNMTNNNKLI